MFRFRAFSPILFALVFAASTFAQTTVQVPLTQTVPAAPVQQTVVQAIVRQPIIQQQAIHQPIVQQQQVVQQPVVWSQPVMQQPAWATQAVAQTQAQTASESVGSYQLINGQYYQLIGGQYYRVVATSQAQTYAQPATQILAAPAPSTSTTTSQPALLDARYRTIHAVIQRPANEIVPGTATAQSTTPPSSAPRQIAAQTKTQTATTQTKSNRGEGDLVDAWLQTQTDPTVIPEFEVKKFDSSVMASFAPTLLDHRQFVENLFETQSDASQASAVAEAGITSLDIRDIEAQVESSTLAQTFAEAAASREARNSMEEASPNDLRAAMDLTTMEVSTFRPAMLDYDAASTSYDTNTQNSMNGFQADYFVNLGGETQRRNAGSLTAGRYKSRKATGSWVWLPVFAVLPLAWMCSRLWIKNEEGQAYSDRARANQDAAIMRQGQATLAQRQRQQSGQQSGTAHHSISRGMVGSTSRENATGSASASTTGALAGSQRILQSDRNVATTAASGFSAQASTSRDEAKRQASGTQSEFGSRYELENADETQSTEVPYQDFMRLRGIDAKTEELLHTNGITHYWQLARTDKRRLRNLLDESGPRFQGTNPGTWPKQAGFAMFGHWDQLQTWLEEQTPGRKFESPSATAEVRTGIRAEQTDDCDTELSLLEDANSLQLSVDRDLTTISEMDETRNLSRDNAETQWETQADAQSETQWESRSIMDNVREEISLSETDFKACDDLTAIQGIGPATESFLNERGIFTYQELCNADVEELRQSLEADDRFRNFEPRKWQRQAEELGQTTELEA